MFACVGRAGRAEWIDAFAQADVIRFEGESLPLPDPHRVVDREPNVTRVEYKSESPDEIIELYTAWFAARDIACERRDRGRRELTITTLSAGDGEGALAIEIRHWEKVLAFTHAPVPR